jgi:hypothetical protein
MCCSMVACVFLIKDEENLRKAKKSSIGSVHLRHIHGGTSTFGVDSS